MRRRNIQGEAAIPAVNPTSPGYLPPPEPGSMRFHLAPLVTWQVLAQGVRQVSAVSRDLASVGTGCHISFLRPYWRFAVSVTWFRPFASHTIREKQIYIPILLVTYSRLLLPAVGNPGAPGAAAADGCGAAGAVGRDLLAGGARERARAPARQPPLHHLRRVPHAAPLPRDRHLGPRQPPCLHHQAAGETQNQARIQNTMIRK